MKDDCTWSAELTNGMNANQSMVGCRQKGTEIHRHKCWHRHTFDIRLKVAELYTSTQQAERSQRCRKRHSENEKKATAAAAAAAEKKLSQRRINGKNRTQHTQDMQSTRGRHTRT